MEDKENLVNHPSHYNQGEVEAINIIKEVVVKYDDGYEGYLVGNVLKYIIRANFKGNKKQDLEKADWYYGKLLDYQNVDSVNNKESN